VGTIAGFFAAQVEALLAGAALLAILRGPRLPFGLLVPAAWLAGSGLLAIEYLLLAQMQLAWNPITVWLPWLPVFALAAWRLRGTDDGRRTTDDGRPKPAGYRLSSIVHRPFHASPPTRLGLIADIVAGAAIVLWTMALIIHTFGLPLTGWDAIAMWVLKGRYFFGAGTVPTVFLTDPYYLIHMDYPMMVPMTVARIYSWIGDNDVVVKGWWSLLAGASAAGLYFGLEGIVGRAARLAGLLLVISLPAMIIYGAEDLAGLADLPLAVFFLYAALFLYRWLHSSSPAEFSLSAFFFGLAAFTKNEGLPVAAFGLATLVALAVIRKRRGGFQMWVGHALALAAIVPWEIEKAVLNITSDLHPTVSAVLQNWQGRIVPILDDLYHDMGDFTVMAEVWLLFVPLAVAGLIFAPRRWLLALPLLLLVAAHFAIIILAFVTTPYDLTWHLSTASGRLIFQVTPIAALLSTIYLGMLLDGVRLPFASPFPTAAESAG
jgi:hypothetical protein